MFPVSQQPPIRRIGFTRDVPYVSQLADASLVADIFDHGVDASTDTRWREYGADTPAEYAYWCSRACGPACGKMAAEAMGGPVRTMMAWIRMGISLGGYLTGMDPSGSVQELGWSHAALAELLHSAGLQAVCGAFTPEEFYDKLATGGHLMIASVSFELGTTQPITHQGGHLVLVSGAQEQDGRISGFYIYNPSGRSAALRENAFIPSDRFCTAYTGRGIDVFKDFG
jgi:hypothetical protein